VSETREQRARRRLAAEALVYEEGQQRIQLAMESGKSELEALDEEWHRSVRATQEILDRINQEASP
jgi:hypothetical protein